MVKILPTTDFRFGILDSIEPQSIPRGAATRSRNWVTEGTKISLRRGQLRLGLTENITSGGITGLGIGTKADGTQVVFRKNGLKLEYYDVVTNDWIESNTANVFPTAALNEHITFAPYQSITGAQIHFNSPNTGPFKIMTANPGDVISLYDSAKNFKGYIRIKQNRMLLWHRASTGTATDLTGVYGGYIDKDEATDYTQISAEAIGAAGSLTYSGTLAFKAGNPKRNCFEVTFTDSVETFIDDVNGNLIGSLGGTGTINYTTGAYSVTFNSVAAGPVTATYRWENASDASAGVSPKTGAICDFTKDTPRTAGQGFVFRQDDGGSPVQDILSLNETEYCMHTLKTWALTITATDTSATNLIYRNRVGIPNFRAACESGDGIYYIDDTDENDPHFRLLSISANSNEVLPSSISKKFKLNSIKVGVDLSDFRFDQGKMIEWGDYIVVACRTSDSTTNNRVFTYNKNTGAIDMHDYTVNHFEIYNGTLIAGDSVSPNVYTLFSGVDEDGFTITENYWEGHLDNLTLRRLKAVRKLVLAGQIGPTQKIKVSISVDNGGFTEVRTKADILAGKHAIEYDGSYVDRTQRVTVGSLTLGRGEIGGGGDGIEAYEFRRIIPLYIDKFEYIKIRFEALDVGYASISEYWYDDIREKWQKLPVKYRG